MWTYAGFLPEAMGLDDGHRACELDRLAMKQPSVIAEHSSSGSRQPQEILKILPVL